MINMRQLTLLFGTSSSKSSVVKLLVAPHSCKFIKRYSQHEGQGKEVMGKERAPSTLEVMEQLSHEKEENIKSLDAKSDQGFVSQTADAMMDAASEKAAGGDDGQCGETNKPRY